MRIKKPALVVTFSTAAEAMKMEKYCLARNLPGRLIPTPQEISAGCGLAWKAPEDARELLVSAMTEGKIHWEDARVLTIWGEKTHDLSGQRRHHTAQTASGH